MRQFRAFIDAIARRRHYENNFRRALAGEDPSRLDDYVSAEDARPADYEELERQLSANPIVRRPPSEDTRG